MIPLIASLDATKHPTPAPYIEVNVVFDHASANLNVVNYTSHGVMFVSKIGVIARFTKPNSNASDGQVDIGPFRIFIRPGTAGHVPLDVVNYRDLSRIRSIDFGGSDLGDDFDLASMSPNNPAAEAMYRNITNSLVPAFSVPIKGNRIAVIRIPMK
jgi:hypothetical protein